MAAGYRIEKWTAMFKPNRAVLFHNLLGEGYEVSQWCDSPGTVYGVHKHDEEQSHWVVSGTLELYIQNVGVFRLGPGDRDFMAAGTYHSARVAGDEPVMYFIGVKKAAKPRRGRKKKEDASDPEAGFKNLFRLLPKE